MTLQQPRSAEGLAADVAAVLEVVGEDVHGERRHADVDFVTVWTLLSRLGVQGPVGLFVSRQVGGGGVVFAALAACVPRLVAAADAGVQDLLLLLGDFKSAFLRASVGDEESFIGEAGIGGEDGRRGGEWGGAPLS